jgi:hypothetical protein
LIVGVQHGRTGAWQVIEQLALAGAHAAQRAETFEVSGCRVRDDADGRLCEPGEVVDLADVIGAELDDGRVVLAIEPHQRQRHADVVVQIALRHADRAADAEDRSDELLDRGLAAAAGNRDDRNRERRAPGARHGTESTARVADLDLR